MGDLQDLTPKMDRIMNETPKRHIYGL